MHWIAALALTVGGPFGFWLEEPPQFMRLDSSGGWPGQVYDFNQFLPPAITVEHRLTWCEQCIANAISRDTRLGQHLRWDSMRCQADRILPPPLRLPPTLSVLQPTGPEERSSSPMLSDAASPRAAGWKMLHTDVTEADHLLLDLTAEDERVRLASVKRLGRLKLLRAVDALTATLRDDPSAVVREAAARALTVIGATGAFPALQQAADADPDANVRRTAQFAVEVLEARDMPGASEAPAASQPPFHFFGFFN